MLSFILFTVSIIQLSSQVADSNFDNFNYDIRIKEPSYFILASRIIRPGQIYSVLVNILHTEKPINVQVNIHRDGLSIGSASKEISSHAAEAILIRVPSTATNSGNYKLLIEGNLIDVLEGTRFIKETDLIFSQRSMTILITTDKYIYKQGQVVRFRCMLITTDLKGFTDPLDIFMIDPNGNIVKRWLSRQSNLGAISLQYSLSDSPSFGNWTIKVFSQGQEEAKNFLVEEYYQTPFEVNVSMPAFFSSTDKYIYGSVMANFSSGVPVHGNLTILATIESTHIRIKPTNVPGVERIHRRFNGYTEFKFKISELANPEDFPLEGAKVTVTAQVGERFLNLIYHGKSRAYILGSKIKLKFLGHLRQVFRPSMPFKSYLVLSHSDGSSIPEELINEKINVTPTIYFTSQAVRTGNTKTFTLSNDYPGIWEIVTDLRSFINYENKLETIKRVVLTATYNDKNFGLLKASLDLYSAYNPSQKVLHISTSTQNPKVGNYILFDIRSNYFITKFFYAIISKGNIILFGKEEMEYFSKTISVSLSSEMAPLATIIIYDISKYEVIADSLTFPVDGITSNNHFSIFLNNQKDKTGDSIEVTVFGQPGSYVGLSALDKSVYYLNAKNQINHADVLRKMNNFDNINKIKHLWISREGQINQFLYLPTPSTALDTNRTFEHAGLIVFTDARVVRKNDFVKCNYTRDNFNCLDTNECYQICDNQRECKGGNNECALYDPYNMAYFRLHRSSRLQRIYDSTWLWEDIYIGPKGYTIFNVQVPDVPTNWVIGAFSMSSSSGFSLYQEKLEYSSLKPFFINVEMPSRCRFGEQIGIRVSLFNYMPTEIEVLLILGKSKDYKFVHVEADGIVSSYSPRTSFGEHHHLILIKSHKSSIVHLPIVSTRLGTINITITAKTQVAQRIVQKSLLVESGGIPQYLHSSIVIDLTQGAHLIKYLDTNLTDKPEIPFRKERRWIYGSPKITMSVFGDVFGPAFHYMPLNATNLLRKPSDCAEQSIFDFAINMYTLLYLRLSSQRDHSIEKEAFHYLNLLYQRILSFQNEDGSFRVFRWNNKPSVWLTAFCVRILYKATFQEWESHIYIDRRIISKAVQWLLSKQGPDGAFYEIGINPYDRKMNLSSQIDDDHVRYRNISLTAHVLIALEGIRDLSGGLSAQNAIAKKSATLYLERQSHLVETLNDPYQLAIVSYALTLVNSIRGQSAFSSLKKKMRTINGMNYWGKEPLKQPLNAIVNNKQYLLPRSQEKYDSLNVETTAYALLSQISRQDFVTRQIVKWLNIYRLYVGGWSSTQDTIIAMQALLEYSINYRFRETRFTNIKVSVDAPTSPNFSVQIDIKNTNLSRLQTFSIPNPYGYINLKASGSGIAIAHLSIQYNVDWPEFQIRPPVKAFDLDVSLRAYGRNNSLLSYRACSRWILIEESYRSGMSVLDLTIPTGYIIQQDVLNEYVQLKKVRNLQEAKFMENKVLFYFDYLDKDPICIDFTIRRWHPVANMTRFIPATVYEYYAPERFEQIMIKVDTLYLLSICHVCGSYQCPYCPLYSKANFASMNAFILINCIALIIFINLVNQII